MPKSLKVKNNKNEKKSPYKKRDSLALREAINERAIRRLKRMKEMEELGEIA